MDIVINVSISSFSEDIAPCCIPPLFSTANSFSLFYNSAGSYSPLDNKCVQESTNINSPTLVNNHQYQVPTTPQYNGAIILL